ncbi:ComEC/Rec2 family competence protein [Herbiconiux sp. L3-i23]|uniref:ComEC/Rec2 family competence protein n=1 Tax=Herbiconiux sp. L3-i23 TaxID=2905871 RepID=UPI00206266DF|nr:ComEC/Rec2 family competence protein [Herbiconiux sp. L3-i23]BDI23087.1 membrane protein [Herbiconiux sp. L3-i23]
MTAGVPIRPGQATADRDSEPGRRTALDLRLLAPALAAWATAGLAVGAGDTGWLMWIGWASTLVAVTLAVLVVRPSRSAWFAALAVSLAVASLVLTVLTTTSQRRSPDELRTAESVDAVVELTGSPIASAATSGGVRVRVLLVDAEVDGIAVPVRSPALLFADADAPQLDAGIGARLRIDARVEPAEAGDSVAWLLFLAGTPHQVAPAPALLDIADGLRESMVEWSSALPGDGGALLPGLAIGDTRAVSESLDEAMTASSLSHLTAVSGANCALVVAAAMGAAGLLRIRRALRVVVALVALGLFVVLVTPQPSVLRAATMAVVVLLATATGRRGSGVAALSLAVIVLLVADPWLSREYGFALSALATAGLLLLAGPITRRLAAVLPEPVAAAIALPVAAQVACQPVLVLLDPSLPLLSVVSNLLAAPAAPVATMLGLLACLALPLAPPLGTVAGWSAWVPSAWIAAVARFFAAIPASLPWLPGLAGAAMLAAAIALIVVGVGRRRRWPLVVGVALVVVTVGTLQGGRIGTALSRPGDWRVVSCDVGQGAATLLRGGDETALIDTGDDPEALARCLGDAGIGRLDLLVLTHFDRDHVGAVDVVAGRVDEVLVGPSDGADADLLVGGLESGGARVRRLTVGETGALGDTAWTVLWPEEGTPAGNGASIALLVDGGGLTSVFLGDLDEQAQDAVLAELDASAGAGGALGSGVDIVGVAHHGSADQSRRLYERLAPAVALVSVGADNDYGHPAPSLIDMLESLGPEVLRTDRSGTAFLSRADGGVAVWTEREDDSVAPAARDGGGG